MNNLADLQNALASLSVSHGDRPFREDILNSQRMRLRPRMTRARAAEMSAYRYNSPLTAMGRPRYERPRRVARQAFWRASRNRVVGQREEINPLYNLPTSVISRIASYL